MSKFLRITLISIFMSLIGINIFGLGNINNPQGQTNTISQQHIDNYSTDDLGLYVVEEETTIDSFTVAWNPVDGTEDPQIHHFTIQLDDEDSIYLNSTNEYTFIGLEPDQSYTVVLNAYTEIDETSLVGNDSIEVSTNPISPVSNLVATDATENSIRVEWDSSPDESSKTNYTIILKNSDGSINQEHDVGKALSYTFINLTPNSQYTIEVSVSYVSDSGSTFFSETVSITASTGDIIDVTNPIAPSTATITNSGGQGTSDEWIEVTWSNDATDNIDIAKYNVVLYSLTASGDKKEIETKEITEGNYSHTFHNLASDSIFVVEVYAVDGHDNVSENFATTNEYISTDTILPTPPSIISISDSGGDESNEWIDVIWSSDASDNYNVESYRVILYSIDESSNKTEIESKETSDFNCTFEHLEPNKVYVVDVYSIDDSGNVSGTFSETNRYVSNDTSPPTLPSTISISDSNQTTETDWITVTWSNDATDNIGIDHYNLQLKNITSGSVEENIDVSNDIFSYTFEDLEANSSYKVELVVFDTSGNMSNGSVETVVYITRDTISPSSPTQIFYSNDQYEQEIRAQWTKDSEDASGILGYTVNLVNITGSSEVIEQTYNATSNEANHIFYDLHANSTYVLEIYATDNYNNVSEVPTRSTEYNTTIITGPPTPPTTVNLDSTGSNQDQDIVIVSWSNDATADDPRTITSYKINAINTTSGEFVEQTQIVDVPTTSCVFDDLQPNSTYVFEVYSIDSTEVMSINGSRSSVYETRDTNAPKPPTNVHIASSNNDGDSDTINVEWNASVDVDVSLYEARLINTSGSSEVILETKSTSNTSISFSGLELESTFVVEVKSIDTVGNESDFARSETYNSSGDGLALPNPENVTITNISYDEFFDTETILVSWDAVDGAVTYNYELINITNGSDPENQVVEKVGAVDGRENSIELDSIKTNSIYEVKVCTVDVEGLESNWTYSNEYKTIDSSPPTPPKNIEIDYENSINDNSKQNKIVVKWDNTAFDISGIDYYIVRLVNTTDNTETAIVENEEIVNDSGSIEYSCEFSNLRLNSRYKVRVYAVDNNGITSTDYAETTTFETYIQNPPGIPTNIRDITTGTISKIEWDPPKNVNGEIFRYKVSIESENGDYSEEIITYDTNLTLTGLKTDTNYNITIETVNQLNAFSLAASETITTSRIDESKPGISNLSTSNIEEESALVFWNSDGYEERYGATLTDKNTNEVIYQDIIIGGTNYLEFNNLNSYTNYEFSVWEDYGNGTMSTIQTTTFRTTKFGENLSPVNPENISIETYVEDNEMVLSWTPVLGAYQYMIYWRVIDENQSTKSSVNDFNVISVPNDETTLIIEDVDFSKEYEIIILPADSKGDTPEFSENYAIFIDATDISIEKDDGFGWIEITILSLVSLLVLLIVVLLLSRVFGNKG